MSKEPWASYADPLPALPLEMQLAAARVVRAVARDEADLADLLEVLGLRCVAVA